MKIFVVGIGPGTLEEMTPRAQRALSGSDIIVGYEGYVARLRAIFPHKNFLSTAMRGETARCKAALEHASQGETVAVVSSGDAGVYGMAGLMLELAGAYPDAEIEVIPGITAACSGAAVLGAPLGHDFAVISLSDLLTPWETIERRLEAAASADFCISLYNPGSKKRSDLLRRACDILLRFRTPETPAGYVREIGREGQSAGVLTLGGLRDFEADMFTTIFVGNSQTCLLQGRLVTPRGYRNV